jgi:hypothetical protein
MMMMNKQQEQTTIRQSDNNPTVWTETTRGGHFVSGFCRVVVSVCTVKRCGWPWKSEKQVP